MINEKELHILKHTIGMRDDQKKVPRVPYRNHFATEPNSSNFEIILGLKEKGLMSLRRNPAHTDGLIFFCVTPEGRKAIREYHRNVKYDSKKTFEYYSRGRVTFDTIMSLETDASGEENFVAYWVFRCRGTVQTARNGEFRFANQLECRIQAKIWKSWIRENAVKELSQVSKDT